MARNTIKEIGMRLAVEWIEEAERSAVKREKLAVILSNGQFGVFKFVFV
jgi:hypothetical protein